MQKISSGEQISISYIQDYTFTLQENKIVSDDHIISIQNEKGVQRKKLTETGFDGKYFMNKGISENNQFVFSIFENSYTLYIKNPTAEFYIEPLQKFDNTASKDAYVFYYAKDAINPDDLNCGFKESGSQDKNNLSPEAFRIGGCKTVELAFSVDYTMYSTYSSINEAINRTLEVLNLTQANYTILNSLSDDVQFKVNEHYVVTCPTCNYWPPTLEIYDNYSSFGSNAYRMFVNHYDLKIHWQNQGGTGTTVGLGAYNICASTSSSNGIGIAVVKNYVSNTNLIRCILSHEIGHNFGCVHTSGYIMNATVSGSNSWAPESIVTINNSLANAICFEVCNVTACDNKKVSDIMVTPDIINDKINISWLSESGIDFKVRLYNYSTNTWSPYNTFSYPANSTFYPFTQVHCSDKYKVEITPVCSGINGISEQVVFEINKNVAAPSLAFNSTAQNQPICGGRPTTFSVTAIDGGTSPAYQWKVNGLNVGTNSAIFTSSTLNNNDVLSCELTSNATCIASPYANVSATITVSVPTVLSVSVSASATTICNGDTVTLTATGTNIQSAFPHYQWFLNGNPMQGSGTGTSGPVITVTPANNGDVYSCTLYDGEGCHTTSGGALSNTTAISILTPCTLSTDDSQISGLSYYPNPVKDELSINAKDEISSIEIYTVLGQNILSEKINSNQEIINLSHLSRAVYFIRIVSGDVFQTIKISKE